jgi:hypothetical protein
MSNRERWAKLKQRLRDRWAKSADLRRVVSWLGRQLFRLTWIAIRVAAALALLYLAREVNRGHLETDEALVAAGLVLAALAALSLTPRLGRGLFTRLSKLNVGPFALELINDAREAATKAPGEDPTGEGEAVSMQALRLRWEFKLSYIANNLLDRDGAPRFVTIGSLAYDGFISEAEERTLAGIMVLRNEDLAELPIAERDEFLKAASQVVGNIRASVLNGYVRTILKQLDGWRVTEIARTPRNDLLVERDSAKFFVAAVLAESQRGGVFERTRKRLPGDGPPGSTALIVVPHTFRPDQLKEDGEPPLVVNTDRLRPFLEEQA